MKTRWNLADLIDLEYLTGRDERDRAHGGEQALAGRDRALYLTRIAPELGERRERPAARDLLRRWLEARRADLAAHADENAEPLPGAVWEEVTGGLSWLALLLGILSGLGLAGAFLVYTGKAPLNVSAFLGIFVVLQVALLALQCLFFLGRRLFLGGRPGAAQTLALRCATACADWAYARLRRGAAGGQRLGFAALLGRLRSRREQAGLFLWPVFLMLQLGGIGFNLGVIGLTLAKVVFSDMAFGWQSSLQLSAAQVAQGVRLAALPWSRFLPEGVGFPSPDQVAGTQIVLKEGIQHLATENLVSWWPFLCMALLVYGLLPRLVLLTAAFAAHRRRLNRLEPRSPELRRLLRRMTTPQVEIGGAAVEHERRRPERAAAADGDDGNAPEDAAGAPEAAALATPLDHSFAPNRLVLAPEEALAALDAGAMLAAVARALGPAASAALRMLPFAAAEEAALLEEIGAAQRATALDEICLVQEAWMPPLQETLHLAARLRRAVGPAAGITVCLLGKPGPDGRPGPAQPEHTAVWSGRLAALADPALEVRPLAEAP